MKLISHRGNIDGRIPLRENEPSYVDLAILSGYDVEVDIRQDSNGIFFLGHDESQYEVTYEWLTQRANVLWIHCKNIEALGWFNKQTLTNSTQFILSSFRYFWHEEDDYTLTSCGKIWTYPNKKLYPNSICVMPKKGFEGDISVCYGVCSDYVKDYKK